MPLKAAAGSAAVVVVVRVDREEAGAGGVQAAQRVGRGPGLVDPALRRAAGHRARERVEDLVGAVGEEVVAGDERALRLDDPVRVEERRACASICAGVSTRRPSATSGAKPNSVGSKSP